MANTQNIDFTQASTKAGVLVTTGLVAAKPVKEPAKTSPIVRASYLHVSADGKNKTLFSASNEVERSGRYYDEDLEEYVSDSTKGGDKFIVRMTPIGSCSREAALEGTVADLRRYVDNFNSLIVALEESSKKAA